MFIEIISSISAALLLLIFIVIDQLRKSLKRTNMTLDKIAPKIGVSDPADDDRIKALLADGRKIEAVKRYRELTGAGLKEATDYIEKLMQ
ncbi:ribosomal protein L7/L12 [Ruminiclostridium sufflavum DSM 19573]|uniref:Ribosomal protein L7/L12 n=1 Tax=Ruminiclostridium sufflavum DSM 19573 TaxID=1121337 RepID=A0A318XPE5_9FIRM|nr:50S ribosomal protein L7/L12 [Ruminiclostridium sufflavum]PYG90181.1 ribosomal protein L7/L12 [Ruminiclostridium sufflavum DSM 19573]